MSFLKESLVLILLVFSTHITVNHAGCGSAYCYAKKAYERISDIPGKIDDAKDVIDDIKTYASVTIPNKIDSISTQITALPNAIEQDVDDLLSDAVTTIQSSMSAVVTRSQGTITSAMKSTVSSAQTALDKSISSTTKTLDTAVSTSTNTINAAISSTQKTLDSSLTTATNAITSAIDDSTDTITNTVETSIDTATETITDWFASFADVLELIEEQFVDVGDDIEDKVSSLKDDFTNLGRIVGKNLAGIDSVLALFLKGIVDASEMPDEWIDQFSDIVDMVGEAKDAVFDAGQAIATLGDTNRRRRTLDAPELSPIIEFNAASIDDDMVWYNTGALEGEAYNIDLNNVEDDLASVDDTQCDAVCFNGDIQRGLRDDCVRLDLDITEDAYPSLSIELYVYQRSIVDRSHGRIFSSGRRSERGFALHSRFHEPDRYADYGIGIGTGTSWEGHEVLNDSVWNRLVAVWDGDADTATLYVNDDDPITQDIKRLRGSNDYVCLNTDPDDTNDDYWDGCIRSIRVYDSALTLEDVQGMKDDSKLVDCTNRPSVQPTTSPTSPPSVQPTTNPTKNPSTSPTMEPTLVPTVSPTLQPTLLPTSTAEGCVYNFGEAMCSGSELGFTTGSNYAGYVSNLLQPKHVMDGHSLIDNSIRWTKAREMYTNGNIYVRIHTAITILNVLKLYSEMVEDVYNECFTFKEEKCPTAFIVKTTVIGTLDTAIWILEMFRDAADIHDGILVTTHLAKIVVDTDVIISNQHVIVEKLEQAGIVNMNEGMRKDTKRNDYDTYYHIPKELAHLVLVIMLIIILSLIWKLNAQSVRCEKVQYYDP
eukprot:58454_1